MLRDGACVCYASQNLNKDTSSLEHAVPNSVKFGVSMDYLPSNCQFFNLKVSRDDFRDQWEWRHFGFPLSAQSPCFSCRFSPQHSLPSYIFVLIKWGSSCNVEQYRADLSWLMLGMAQSRWLWCKACYTKQILAITPGPYPSCIHTPASVSSHVQYCFQLQLQTICLHTTPLCLPLCLEG